MAKRETNCGKPEKQEEQTHKQEAQSRTLLLALRAVGQEQHEACSFLGYASGPSEVPRELLGRWAKGAAGNSACLPLWRRWVQVEVLHTSPIVGTVLVPCSFESRS